MAPTPAPFFRSCNFCGGQDFRGFRTLDHLQYLQCRSCELIGVNPCLPRDSPSAHPDFSTYEQGKLDLVQYNHAYLSLGNFRARNRLFEVNCGPGVTLNWFARHAGWQVAGADPDPSSLRIARERYGLSLTHGLLSDLREPAESFDVAWMDNALHRIFDPLGTLLSAFALLRPGGACVIFVPNGESLSVRYLDQQLHPGHWFLYTPATLFRLLRQIGFSVTKLAAAQSQLSPALTKHLDVSPTHPALRVMVAGEQRIGKVLTRTSCWADYFTMVAVKPADASTHSPRESELRQIAAGSLVERPAVRISGSRAEPATGELLASLDGRLISRFGEDRVYYVDNGIRRWVTSRAWLEAQGLCLPDDVTPLDPALFASLPEGPEIPLA